MFASRRTSTLDTILGLPWVGILGAVVVIIAIVLSLLSAKGRERLMDFGYRILDALLPRRDAALERKADRELQRALCDARRSKL